LASAVGRKIQNDVRETDDACFVWKNRDHAALAEQKTGVGRALFSKKRTCSVSSALERKDVLLEELQAAPVH
jgi:hypothetical protein